MSANELPVLKIAVKNADGTHTAMDVIPAAVVKARIEALELDARRYRWLMDNYARGDGFDRIDDVLNEGDANGRLSAAIDAAIDAELSKDNRP